MILGSAILIDNSLLRFIDADDCIKNHFTKNLSVSLWKLLILFSDSLIFISLRACRTKVRERSYL